MSPPLAIPESWLKLSFYRFCQAFHKLRVENKHDLEAQKAITLAAKAVKLYVRLQVIE